MKPYSLDEVHDEIQSIYYWWAIHAPGVTPQEENELGALWAIADQLHEEDQNG